MQANKVWKLVDKTRVMLDGKRANIFKKKLEADGSIRFKARLVIRGFNDKNVYDLKETYAPVSQVAGKEKTTARPIAFKILTLDVFTFRHLNRLNFWSLA